MWPNFDGKPYTRAQLAAHINACDFSTWKHKDGSGEAMMLRPSANFFARCAVWRFRQFDADGKRK
jgi:hypothetical protein